MSVKIYGTNSVLVWDTTVYLFMHTPFEQTLSMLWEPHHFGPTVHSLGLYSRCMARSSLSSCTAYPKLACIGDSPVLVLLWLYVEVEEARNKL